MTYLILALFITLLIIFVLTLIEKFVIEPKRKLTREIKKLKSKLDSKEFIITCLETQLLCKDMQIDLLKLPEIKVNKKESNLDTGAWGKEIDATLEDL